MKGYYFAYGSNMNPKRLKDRIGKFYSAESAKVKGYKLTFNKISNGKQTGYATIEKSKRSITEGILYEIDIDSFNDLDIYEGIDIGHYKKQWINVILSDNTKILALTYIATKKMTSKKELKPTKMYISHLLKGKKYLSKDYYKKLLNIHKKAVISDDIYASKEINGKMFYFGRKGA